MMKYIIRILILLFFLKTSLVFAQKDPTGMKYSIGLKIYNPIFIPAMDKFFNESWATYGTWWRVGPEKRTYYKYAFGIDFKYHINKNISIKLWGGVSNRIINESVYDEYSYCSTCDLQADGTKFKYEQISYNSSVGINLSERINQFEFNTGLEISYLRTGIGKREFNNFHLNFNTSLQADSIDGFSKQVIAPGNSYGLGFYIGTEYNILKHFSISIEFHEFIFYSIFTNTSTEEYRNYTRENGIITRSENGYREYSGDFRQLAFSNILPVMNFLYKF